MADLNLRGNAFWKQFKEPLNNVSYDEISHIADLFNKYACINVTKIIDFGCGTGLSAHLLKRRYPKAEVTAIDLSCAAIKIAHENFNDVTWLHADIKDLNISASMLFSMGVRYADLPWLVKLARKTCGGLAVFSVASWIEDYDKREPGMNKLLLAPNGSNKQKATDLIFSCDPKYFESDQYKFYAIF